MTVTLTARIIDGRVEIVAAPGARREQQRLLQRKLYARRRLHRVCVKCGSESAGKARCPKHALKHLIEKRFTRKDVVRHGSRKNPGAL